MRSPESPQYRLMLEVLTQFRVVVANTKKHYRNIEQTIGVSGTQLWTLIAVSQQPGITVGKLARELAIHQSTASNLLDRLFELGHISRAREGNDQRVVSVYLTEQGKKIVRRAPQPAMGLLQNALALLADAATIIPPADLTRLRRFAETEIRKEKLIDNRYDALARRLMDAANRGAARARAGDVQRVLNQIPREDSRLGRRRPEVIQALQYSVQGQLAAARRLRLQRDQWELRKTLYREYQKAVGPQLLQLVKSQPALEAIRRLDGPPPDTLVTLQARLTGGAARLERTRVPADLRAVHDLVLGAWRFAETAVRGRYDAARAANVNTAWEASSSAAGALMLLSRAQQELRTLLEPPRLQ